jgi:uncharacterized protein
VEKLIRASGMSLLVSMDGDHDATSYRPYASGRSSYPAVARNLPRLADWSSDVMVRMTFHPQALDLVDNVGHVLEMGAPAIALCPVLEVSWDGYEQALERAYEYLADWYLEQARLGSVPPLSVTNTLLKQLHRNRLFGERPIRPCGVGTSMLGVDVDGNVMPCHRFLYRPDDRLGRVEQPALNDKRAQYVELTSRSMIGCDTCMANLVCGGGCRAVAVHAGLRLNEPHPNHCLTMRAHARVAYRIYDTLMAEGNPAFARMLGSPSSVGPVNELAFR